MAPLGGMRQLKNREPYGHAQRNVHCHEGHGNTREVLQIPDTTLHERQEQK
jgi:hypothetical protein